jgi:hypothetical protein
MNRAAAQVQEEATVRQPAPLQYEMPRRWRITARARRVLIIGLGVVVAVALWQSKLPEEALARWRLAQCAEYCAVADQVVYEEHNGPDVAWTAEDLRQLPHGDRTGTRRYVEPPACLRPFSGQDVAPLFIGELTAEDGHRTVVALVLDVRSPSRDPVLQNVFSPEFCKAVAPGEERPRAPLGPAGRWLDPGGGNLFALFNRDQLWRVGPFTYARVLRFYAGHRDPNDPSHFTVDFEADDRRVRLHGRLVNSQSLILRVESQRRDSIP